MHTIQDISKVTSLKLPFIRKALKNMDSLFDEHTQRGKHNSIFFSHNALQIFQRIKELKSE
jgi:hypothetical protein